MAYCSLDDVRALRRSHPIDDTTKPSAADVNGILDRLQDQIEGVLRGLGFLTPVVGPASVTYLRSLLAIGVAGFLDDGRHGGSGGEPTTTPKSVYTQKYEAMLAAIEKNEKILTDAAKVTSLAFKGAQGRPVMESFFTQNPTDEPAAGLVLEGSAAPRFRVRQEF